ncbi:unnamed protein product [Adineta steineri]|uniref:Uncharacterized protein n=1 Tax=Adineta steineri TaxID=433720 RepID=A0A813WUQ0_9BILA|nr:unnamed protein product [Adineta steineri]CAF1226125.1 unnamed protein product [Adineta steineri]
MSALHEACRNGDFEIVQQLLPTLSIDKINQVELSGTTSLHAVCSFNHPRIVKLLLDHRVVRSLLNKDGRTAMEEVAIGQTQIFSRSLFRKK